MAQEVPAGKPGRISGVVFDAKSGEKLTGVTVRLDLPSDTAAQAASISGKTVVLGAKTNLNGEYLVRSVPPGIYIVTVSIIGYAKSVIPNVEVTPDGVAKLDVSLSTADVQLKDEIKVQARRDPKSTSANDAARKNASGAMDFVSAEQIGKSGAGDAQSALSKVTGVSVMGDQAYVRGVSDRYLSVQVNGSSMPSSDPDKQTFRTDIFSSSLLDNISIQKTYTPDQPGNFTGGAVNLTTKSYPETRTLTVSGSLVYNELVTLNDNFLTSPGSSTDKWGYDNGHRALPEFIKQNMNSLPGAAPFYSAEQARLSEEALRSFNNELEPTRKQAPYNRSIALSYGDNLPFFNRSLGVVATLTYDRSFAHYDDGLLQRYNASYDTSSSTEPSASIYAGGKEESSKNEVMIGALGTLSYSLTDNHDLGFTYVRNQSGENRVQKIQSLEQLSITRPSFYRMNTLAYTERSLESYQLKGGHRLMAVGNSGVRLDWQLSSSTSVDDNPDYRMFYDLASVTDNIDSLGNPILDTNFVPQAPGSTYSQRRFWRYLDETNREARADLTIPVSRNVKVKTGFDYLIKDRDVEEYNFELINNIVDYTDKFGVRHYYDGNWEEYLKDAGGIRDTTNGRYRLGPTYVSRLSKESNYAGNQTVTSIYGMTEYLPVEKLKLIVGARFEKTEMDVSAVYDTTSITKLNGDGIPVIYNSGDKIADLQTNDWLPSFNAIYMLTEKMNIRGAYSRTLARPNIRELSPAKTFESARGVGFIGNPDLKRTLVDNVDLRWEWFTKPGEVLAVTGFYKKFKDPIEIGFVGVSSGDEYLTPSNVSSARLYGVEIEVRKNLTVIHSSLRSFFIGANATMTSSKADLSALEAQSYRLKGLDPTRPMQGQAPYIVNGDLTYQNGKSGTRASFIYNIVGDRLYINSNSITPDVYEKHCSMLDFSLSQSLLAGLTFKFSAKNILNEKLTRYYDLQDGTVVEMYDGSYVKGAEGIFQQYSIGQSFSAGLSWQIW